VTSKLCALIDLAIEPLDDPEKAKLCFGVAALRDLVAASAPPNQHEQFVRSFVAQVGRALSLFRDGLELPPGSVRYLPISANPVQAFPADPYLTISGSRELATAVGLLGMGVRVSGWRVDIGAAGSARPGVLRLQAGSSEAQIFFAANPQSGVRMITHDHVSLMDDAVIIHSYELTKAMPRSPRSAPGRIGISGLREVSITELSVGIDSADLLLQRFREEVAL
jgi:hypothetical protein